ncbi:THUMP domain-containing protein 3 isoform X2 [Xenopus laevis]|nr:THUMP domain-containing protein 3 isoform X2 [Xenopus laevis]
MAQVDEVASAMSEVTLADTSTVPCVDTNSEDAHITIGATVPTGFEFTAAAEVEEKLGCPCKISKDRGKIYFDIKKDGLAQVHRLRSVDNLFVIVKEFTDFPFKETKEDALKDLQDLVAKLPWEKALSAWELNNSLKKRKKRKKAGYPGKERKQPMAVTGAEISGEEGGDKEQSGGSLEKGSLEDEESGLCKDQDSPTVIQHPREEDAPAKSSGEMQEPPTSQASSEAEAQGSQHSGNDADTPPDSDGKDNGTASDNCNVLKFRVTCNRSGDKHSFTSNDAARDFGGAVQDHFQWKADMTKFDVEVLLNISFNEMVVGIALTEESLHRRNITHFGPTTLRSTLAYGMLRLCDLQPSDVIIDPMCGTGSIPIEGVNEWPGCFFLAGDNNKQAVNRTGSNIQSLLRKHQSPESAQLGLPIDAVHWDISSLPLREGSVDVIVTDMPFGKRMGSKKKNWDLYPACLREMSRVCRAGTGRAVLLTHDRKCFIKALAKAGHLWRKMHTVWVNIGGLHAGVYLLKRTSNDSTKEMQEGSQTANPAPCPKEE